MKRETLLALALVVVVAACAQAAPAPRRGAGPAVLGGEVVAESVRMSTTVVSVDQAKHTITLRMPDGTTKTYSVPSRIKNLSAFKKGDMINVTTVDTLAVYVEKGGGAPSASEWTKVKLLPKGMGTGGILARTIRITGKIEKIDQHNRTITITSPAYKARTFKVGQNVKNLGKLKVGDDIVLRYTERLAIDMRKPA